MDEEIKTTVVEEVEKDDAQGTVIIEDQVIYEYVTEEVLKFKEVSRLVGGITESFSKNILGREPAAQGIKVIRDGSNITINIHLIMYYGVNIPQVSYDIQTDVKNAVESFTGLTVDAVNIGVEGIDRKKD
ncbi:MAG: Asp23/Gls24 family envelope stress response protein [Mogibacterium sp.]|nr:Asp23/Gls24 family envelope stress response protein [Mogibacterium sp.]